MDVTEENPRTDQDVVKPDGFFGARHVQYLFMFSGIVISYGMRTVLNVAIVAMIDDKQTDDYPTYPEWSDEKNLIISSFFWGYICFQVGAGQLAKYFGAKRFLGGAVFMTSMFSIFIPLFGAWFGYRGVIACRIIQGLCQGFLFPSIHTLLSLWAPLSERTKWGGIIYAGQPVGNVICMPATGTIAGSSLGWPVAFYLYGALGITWTVLWLIWGSNSPAEHKSISQDEKKWIEAELHEDEDLDETVATPWKAIFTSVPFYALLVTHCGQSWGFSTLLTEIPSYLKEVLGYDMKSNGLLSALPYFVMFLMNIVLGVTANTLIKKKIVTLTASRKIFNSIGHYVPGLLLIALTFVGRENKGATVALLVLAVGMNAGQYVGFNLNHMDIAPIHAGTLMGLTNSISTVFSIFAPLAVDFIETITGYKEDQKELWNIVFFTAAGFFIAVGTVFNILGTAEVQPWNNIGASEKAAKYRQKKMSFISILSN